MIFIMTQKVDDTKEFVTLRNHNPESIPKELISQGYMVDCIPEPEKTEGKAANLYRNPQDGTFFYEYLDIPPTPEEQMAQELANQKAQLAQVLLSNAELVNTNELLKKQNADILLRLAKNNIN